MKKRLIPFILLGLVLVQLPSHDQDLWTASLDKARAIAVVLEESYYKPLDEEALAVASIKGTLDTLDPHSYFLDPDSF